MTDEDKSLWAKVAATVTRFGEKRPNRVIAFASLFLPSPPTILDLHGYTVEDAHQITKDFISDATTKTVTIITGKSGQIRREFERWMELNPTVKSWSEKNGGGAFTVSLKSF